MHKDFANTHTELHFKWYPSSFFEKHPTGLDTNREEEKTVKYVGLKPPRVGAWAFLPSRGGDLFAREEEKHVSPPLLLVFLHLNTSIRFFSPAKVDEIHVLHSVRGRLPVVDDWGERQIPFLRPGKVHLERGRWRALSHEHSQCDQQHPQGSLYESRHFHWDTQFLSLTHHLQKIANYLVSHVYYWVTDTKLLRTFQWDNPRAFVICSSLCWMLLWFE